MNAFVHPLRFLALLLALMCLLGVVACTPTPDPDTESETETAPLDTPAVTDTSTEPETSVETETETETDSAPTTDRPSQEVSVISMNLDANEATIASRAKLMMPVLLALDADSIGVQEARGSWVNQLQRNLQKNGYTRVGVDAGGNQNATQGYFATYIFFKTDKFKLVDSGTFWMSKTPDVPSIYDSTVDCNRTCTWALLEDKTTGFRYVHMNTHLDWMNTEVNRIQVSMIREQIERFEAMGYPVFATGDYNCDEGTASYHEMLKSDITADAKHVAEKSMNLGTYPDYGKYDVTVSKPIDYVFVTKNHMTVHEYRVIDDKPNGEYMSDHNGLYVRATVHAMPLSEVNAPVFSEGASISAETSGPSNIQITFPQAVDRDGIPAMSYRVELLDATDALVLKTTVHGALFLPEPPATLSARLSKLADGTSYTIRVTPISILGVEGEAPLTLAYTFQTPAAPVTPEAMSGADIFDLAIRDGQPVDASPNGLEIQTVGTPTVEGSTLVFDGSGNYKIPGIRDHYAKLEDGFTAEILLTVGDNISGYSNPAANFHAGGFGYSVDAGRLTFQVRLDGGYVVVGAPIEANMTYHAVAVYDAETGNLSLYLDGSLADNAAGKNMGHPTDAGAKYLCLGADSDASGKGEYPYSGTLQLFRLYDAPASAGQALWLFEETK